jgi:polyphosphate kinase 2 (PPK2 family)/predicted alpha/beta hydrolase family esterase
VRADARDLAVRYLDVHEARDHGSARDVLDRATVLIVPGLRDHVEDHWQTHLARALPRSFTVPRLAEGKLVREAWVVALDLALASIDGPVVLAAHSAGAIIVAHWAARSSRPIAGALLAAPADLETPLPPGYASIDELRANGWLPIPRAKLPFPSIVVAGHRRSAMPHRACRGARAPLGQPLRRPGPRRPPESRVRLRPLAACPRVPARAHALILRRARVTMTLQRGNRESGMAGKGERRGKGKAKADGARAAKAAPASEDLSNKDYEKALKKLHVELVRLQEWVKHAGLKVCIVFEGRDGAGKGGTIKALTERVSPRVFRVIALPAPTERQLSQMYLQRYITYLPAAGEVVIFDRSWYNRAGVERVMGFTARERGQALPRRRSDGRAGDRRLRRRSCSSTGSRSAWTSRRSACSDASTTAGRIWKLSPMDLKSYGRWDDYSLARDEMFAATDSSWAPWYVVRSDHKRRAPAQRDQAHPRPHPVQVRAAREAGAAEAQGRQVQGIELPVQGDPRGVLSSHASAIDRRRSIATASSPSAARRSSRTDARASTSRSATPAAASSARSSPTNRVPAMSTPGDDDRSHTTTLRPGPAAPTSRRTSSRTCPTLK